MPSDRALLNEMNSALLAFDAGRLPLRALLDRLEVCVDNLGDKDLPWNEAFRREWGRIEDAYAYASFKGWTTISDQDMPAVNFALAEIKRLVAEKTSPSG